MVLGASAAALAVLGHSSLISLLLLRPSGRSISHEPGPRWTPAGVQPVPGTEPCPGSRPRPAPAWSSLAAGGTSRLLPGWRSPLSSLSSSPRSTSRSGPRGQSRHQGHDHDPDTGHSQLDHRTPPEPCPEPQDAPGVPGSRSRDSDPTPPPRGSQGPPERVAAGVASGIPKMWVRGLRKSRVRAKFFEKARNPSPQRRLRSVKRFVSRCDTLPHRLGPELIYANLGLRSVLEQGFSSPGGMSKFLYRSPGFLDPGPGLWCQASGTKSLDQRSNEPRLRPRTRVGGPGHWTSVQSLGAIRVLGPGLQTIGARVEGLAPPLTSPFSGTSGQLLKS